ncbi:phosphoribosylanthranilate isomerase [Niveibacterium sp. 24ML]|uniref:phosphoribosylanthranilate isomerase n=1 Tax=Niveibacterium sp. 24ML TaxID=2985512 RepID=UPI002271AB92|nr:phosphoribosylanthranilate isomerase [Niveibacterium sp. 24ML]MCX9155136.1 phosphoribosylanthranilate isomerase [Niveibacterium sp. 24ML]
MKRTRVKICGLTRPQDVQAAVAEGADALGFVFYPKSPRFVDAGRAADLALHVPPFVTIVGLFVNPEPADVESVLAAVPVQLLQFHGDEDPTFCEQFGRPYIKAVRMRAGVDLLHYAASFASAQALLVDAFAEGYGGSGETFDWALIPPGLSKPLILSGGLSADNVSEAIRRIHPVAVDVSSGVESGKGIKDARRIADFIAGVRSADG